jgi:hypothetical protein
MLVIVSMATSRVDKKLLGISVFTALIILLSACQDSSLPTQEVNALYTAGAQTVVSRLTESAIRSTPIPRGTEIQSPPDLMDPDIGTISPDSSLNLTLPSPFFTKISAGYPTETPENGNKPSINNRPDRCQWVEQDPPDSSSIAANTGFTTTWVLKNAGISTWNKQFQAVWYNANGSDRIGPGKPLFYYLTNDVAPNEVYRLKVEMQANLKPGKYYSLWGLKNSAGITFCTFDLTIKVI